jgi:hypothetical protein
MGIRPLTINIWKNESVDILTSWLSISGGKGGTNVPGIFELGTF